MGHIEDIAVDADQQGKKLGLRIIEALKYIGAKMGCYKVILDCSAKVNSDYCCFYFERGRVLTGLYDLEHSVL